MHQGFQFTEKDYQKDAVSAVVACFDGQSQQQRSSSNAAVELDEAGLLANIRSQQLARKLPLSAALSGYTTAAPINFDVEMETGTGKTLVYLQTTMELHKTYGWSRYIIVVPSIAIREGVKQTLAHTEEYLRQRYATAPVPHVYDSGDLQLVRDFSDDDGKVHVLVINAQAFNRDQAKSARQSDPKNQLRLFRDDQENFGGERPIDLLARTRPILIIDEPQRLGGDPKRPSATLKALASFEPLMALRYSATHKIEHNLVYRLDARDAYQQQLVKRVVVTGLTAVATVGNARVEVLKVERGAERDEATLRLDQPTRGVTKPVKVTAKVGDKLGELTKPKNLEYGEIKISGLDLAQQTVELSNGEKLAPAALSGSDRDFEKAVRRWQLGEVIDAHFKRERELFSHNVKALSLFFIDEVKKYKDYSKKDQRGVYARLFEEAYKERVQKLVAELEQKDPDGEYLEFLKAHLNAREAHSGYFSTNVKGQLIDGEIEAKGENQGQSKDTAAYDLILKDKLRLLSFDEPVRFIFSHSALREGWDNPNVFTIGTLKRSDNLTSRRQEIGRGLRIAVDQAGKRLEPPNFNGEVQNVNILTVVTDESYTSFVRGLQSESAGGREQQRLDPAFFEGSVPPPLRFRCDNSPSQ